MAAGLRCVLERRPVRVDVPQPGHGRGFAGALGEGEMREPVRAQASHVVPLCLRWETKPDQRGCVVSMKQVSAAANRHVLVAGQRAVVDREQTRRREHATAVGVGVVGDAMRSDALREHTQLMHPRLLRDREQMTCTGERRRAPRSGFAGKARATTAACRQRDETDREQAPETRQPAVHFAASPPPKPPHNADRIRPRKSQAGDQLT
jgi:hypothetical protein